MRNGNAQTINKIGNDFTHRRRRVRGNNSVQIQCRCGNLPRRYVGIIAILTCLYVFVHAAAGHDFGAPGTDQFNGVPAKVHDDLSSFFTLMSDFAEPWSVGNNPLRIVGMTSCDEGGLGPMVTAWIFPEGL